MSTAVIIGRFQPLSMVQLDMINHAKEHHDNVLILVGSSNRNPNHLNPLTFEQRKEMLSNACSTAVIKALPDLPMDDEWVMDIYSRMSTMEENPDDITLYCGEDKQQYYTERFLCNIEAWPMDTADPLLDWWYGDDGSYGDIPNVTLEMYEFFSDAVHERLTEERDLCNATNWGYAPVPCSSVPVVIYKNNVLVGKRTSPWGHDQLGLPVTAIKESERSREAAIRTVKEQSGIDLSQVQVTEKADAVEENLDNMGFPRYIGLTYMFHILDESEFTSTADLGFSELVWVPLSDILQEKVILFHNHNLVVQRLFAKL